MEVAKTGTLTITAVGEERRRPRSRQAGGSPVVQRLLAGETLLIKTDNGKPYSTGWTNKVLRAKGMKAVTRNDPDGTVVWAEPVEETTEAVATETPSE